MVPSVWQIIDASSVARFCRDKARNRLESSVARATALSASHKSASAIRSSRSIELTASSGWVDSAAALARAIAWRSGESGTPLTCIHSPRSNRTRWAVTVRVGRWNAKNNIFLLVFTIGENFRREGEAQGVLVVDRVRRWSAFPSTTTRPYRAREPHVLLTIQSGGGGYPRPAMAGDSGFCV